LLWKSKRHYILWVYFSSLIFPACNGHVPYYVICGLSGSTTFFQCLINSRICGRKSYWSYNVCVDCLLNFAETFLILRRTVRDIAIKVHTSAYKVPIALVKFEWNFNFLDKFSKVLKLKFHENLSSGSRFVPCGRTDRQTWRSCKSLYAIFADVNK
jgi:hypothetical protein